MPTGERLIAGTTEAAEWVVGLGTNRGGHAKCDADIHQESREKTEAPAHCGNCVHKQPSAEYANRAAALALGSIAAERLTAVADDGRAPAR